MFNSFDILEAMIEDTQRFVPVQEKEVSFLAVGTDGKLFSEVSCDEYLSGNSDDAPCHTEEDFNDVYMKEVRKIPEATMEYVHGKFRSLIAKPFRRDVIPWWVWVGSPVPSSLLMYS